MQAYSVFLTCARSQDHSEGDAENGPYGPFSKQKLLNGFTGKVRLSRAARLALFDAEVGEHELRNVVPEL